jgi:hypothetical protein
MPMLVTSGEKALRTFLIQQGRLFSENVEGIVIEGSGHWLPDEVPDQVIPQPVDFFSKCLYSLSGGRTGPFPAWSTMPSAILAAPSQVQ